MNRPSRTDDVDKHPGWNQSPPFLAADLTTCQDLNGIANSRTHRDGSDGDGSLSGSHDEKDYLTLPALQPDKLVVASGWCSQSGTHARSIFVSGGEGLSRLSKVITPSTQSKTWSWITWTFSVICCSALLSSVGSAGEITSLFSMPKKRHDLLPRGGSAPLTKRSTCATGGVNNEQTYNTPLHVGALIIILSVSFFACAFPLIATRFPRLKIPAPFFFAVRHFGTGVLLATAFVHLLPTAFILLGNPCLSSFWVNDYPAMPGAIALGGVFFVTIIEMVFQPARHMSHASVTTTQASSGTTSQTQGQLPISDDGLDDGGEPLPMEMGPLHGTTSSLGRQLSRIARQDADDHIRMAQDDGQAGNRLAKGMADLESQGGHGGHGQGVILTPAQQHEKAILQCMMLEVGILFHSVFIGMTLSVSVGQNFVIFLIAVTFHQSFEGLALGSRIAAIDWPEGSLQPWFMAVAYGCTTPIGQAIGLATHSLYSPNSEFGLVLVGTMNAISSGLLVFASLVELLSEDFLSDESWRILRGRKRVYACLLVFFGAFGMSLVGAWA